MNKFKMNQNNKHQKIYIKMKKKSRFKSLTQFISFMRKTNLYIQKLNPFQIHYQLK